MRLSQLYSNKKDFKNLKFNPVGLNVVYADVKTKIDDVNNSHNLGKSILIELIDFMLLKGISNKRKHFLYSSKISESKSFFEDHVFYIELIIKDDNYLTIKRNIQQNTKISFKVASQKVSAFIPPTTWDYENEPLENAKEILSTYLSFPFFSDKEYDYRKSLNYSMRGQRDYQDIYRLNKFVGRDLYWKPFIFDFLGFNGKLLREKYLIDDDIKEQEEYIQKLKLEFGINPNERDEIIALKNIKNDELISITQELDKFNFYENDKKLIESGVNKLEEKISHYNSLAYKLEYELKKIRKALKTKISFNLNKIEKVYNQVKISFPQQLKKDYQELILFNKKISEERTKKYKKIENIKSEELNSVNSKLQELNSEKEELLSFLQNSDTFSKFKNYQKSLVKSEAELQVLQQKLDGIEKIVDKEKKLKERKKSLENKIEEIIKEISTTETNNRYNSIREKFSDYYNRILGEKAFISLSPNSANNIDFNPPKVLNQLNSNETAQGKGYTYAKLFCICFDLAILATYSEEPYYRFVYHDDVLANEDDGVKQRLIRLINDVCSTYNIQYILSTIKSDLPTNAQGEIINFSKDETILELHDKDESGTLFGFKF